MLRLLISEQPEVPKAVNVGSGKSIIMEKGKVEMFMISNGNKFPTENLKSIKESLEKMSDDNGVFLHSLSLSNPTTALVLGILFGADRIYLGQIGLGLFKIVTMFFLVGLLWWFIDLFSILRRAKEHNFEKFSKITAYSR